MNKFIFFGFFNLIGGSMVSMSIFGFIFNFLCYLCDKANYFSNKQLILLAVVGLIVEISGFISAIFVAKGN